KAAQITQGAEAYREQTVAEAKGATSRFLQVYDEYKKAPDVTRQRMYLETMERLFGGTDKIIVDQGGGVVPYLPLDQLSRRLQTPAQTGGSRGDSILSADLSPSSSSWRWSSPTARCSRSIKLASRWWCGWASRCAWWSIRD